MRLIYLSPVPWGSFSQRPHELVRYFHARTGGDVLWVDPYPGRFPTLSDVMTRRPHSGGLEWEIPAWLRVVQPKALPIEPFPFSGAINRLFWGNVEAEVGGFTDDSTVLGIGKPTTLALQLMQNPRFSSSFYDAMDNYPAFYRGWSRLAIGNRELKVIKGVSTILSSSSAIQERMRQLATDVRLVMNACAVARLPPLPVPCSFKDGVSPVVGYVGTIGAWFDWGLVVALAKSNLKINFRLIGPVYVRPPVLPHNISLEPAMPHAEALRAMARFSAGLIPFKETPLTSSVDPIKYYEYRALGLPVISSAFGEMARRRGCDGVYLTNPEAPITEMAELVREALTSCTTAECTGQFRRDNSWESRFDNARIFG
jgi:glycosyltransferase involved in cell wall biosynthesis